MSEPTLRRLFLLLATIVLCLGGACDTSILQLAHTDGPVAPPDAATMEAGAPVADLYQPVDSPSGLTLAPLNPMVIVATGKPTPTVAFTVKHGAKVVTASWTLEQGEFGSVNANGLFTPSGTSGGKVKITATAGKLSVSTQISVLLNLSQNGLTKANGNPGPGGFGGVGGEGLGPAVDSATIKLLTAAATPPGTLALIYPYDKTVWPLGILAPLIQWSALPTGTGEAVLIQLQGTYFTYKGTFGRPAALAKGAALVRHPIPQDIWKAATRSAAGATLTLRVVVASAGKGYGPLVQTWKVARGQLRGTVYYQSYGTNLAKNYTGAKGGDGKFGGATLAIRGGSTDPTLVAGKTGSTSGCRVCHSVAAGGTRMVVQHGDNYKMSSSYDLFKSYAETAYTAPTYGKLGWIGMTPDGKLGLGNAVPIPGAANTGDTALYDMASGATLSTSGLTGFVTRAGFPMFSPDGKAVAFTFYAGTGTTATGSGDGNKLVVMDFNPATRAFAKPKVVYTGQTGSRPGWPAFWPTGKALLFQRELSGNTSGEYFATRYGGRGDIYWVDLISGKSGPLDLLNGKVAGKSYLPVGANKHDADAALNYEPTVSPIASGGYAWVVFMSRRLYGNVATINPWESDPRIHDLTKTPTPKKLWVAALDLNPKAGTDPSHPAFYLPAQELLAGNTRGFWVADPCKADKQPCTGGDQCCGGYCIKDLKTSKMICGKGKLGCAKELDKCAQSSECCNYPKFLCINGYCTRWDLK